LRAAPSNVGAVRVTARADDPFSSVDDLWRRAGVPSHSLVQIAEGDAMQPSLKLARREALWAIKGLRDEPLQLFAKDYFSAGERALALERLGHSR
jgi:error-prone DNA polymerase